MAHDMWMGDDQMLRVRLWGDLAEKDATAFSTDFRLALDAASDEVHSLVDVAGVGRSSARARRVFRDMFSNPHPRVGRTALVGANRYVRVAIGFIMKVTGATETRLFDSEEEAVAWLRSRRPALRKSPPGSIPGADSSAVREDA